MTVHTLHSSEVGDDFSISVAACGDAPRSTLIVTDADGLFGLAVDTIRMMQLPALVPSMLVVGIGYPGASSIIDTIGIRGTSVTAVSVAASCRPAGSSADT